MTIFKNFSFLDQLLDTTIDLTQYITDFSTDVQNLEFRNIQPVVATIKNLFEFQTLIDDFKNRGTAFRFYRVKDGELPEDVAIRFYGSEDFWWVICLFNDIKNPLTDWPLIDEQLNYLADTLSTIEDKYSRNAYYDLLFDKNEINREINILKNEQLPDLIFQFRNRIVAEDTLGNRFTIRV